MGASKIYCLRGEISIIVSYCLQNDGNFDVRHLSSPWFNLLVLNAKELASGLCIAERHRTSTLGLPGILLCTGNIIIMYTLYRAGISQLITQHYCSPGFMTHHKVAWLLPRGAVILVSGPGGRQCPVVGLHLNHMWAPTTDPIGAGSLN